MRLSYLLLILLGSCAFLFVGCCGGFLYWGYTLNVQEARRDYADADQLWSSGSKAEAVEKYRKVKQTYLDGSEQAVLKRRVQQFEAEQTQQGLAAGHQDWEAGRKDAAAERYRKLDLTLLDSAERDRVRERLKEVDTALAKADLAQANEWWSAGETTKAVAKYRQTKANLLEVEDRTLLTQRLFETANQKWEAGRKAEAASIYGGLERSLLSEAEQSTAKERIEESAQTDAKYAKAKKSRHGKQVQLGTLDLRWTSDVTTEEARSAGDFLQKAYSTDNASTVQLARQGKTYQVRLVVKKGIDRDEEFVPVYKGMALRMMLEVFPDSDVEIHLCDDKLETLRVVIPLRK